MTRIALALLLLATPAAAQWRVEGFAGAGFSCENEVAIDERGVYDAAGTRDATQSWYVARERLECKPAVSTGMVFGRWPATGRLGYGVGAHVCACAGTTSLYPAVTVHVGRIARHLYVGLSWTPEDRVRFPNGREEQHLARGLPTDEFILRDYRSSVSLLIGFVIGATSFTGGS